MKILFIGDYSALHATLARILREMGHDCTVISDGGRCMDSQRDISLTRSPGILGGFGYLGKVFSLWPTLKGYDVVQLINPNFLHLRPGKLRYFLKELRRANGLVSLSLAGTDPVFAKACIEDGRFRYSEFLQGSEPTPWMRYTPGLKYAWLNGGMGDYCRFVYESIDCAQSVLYEYHVASKPYLPSTPLDYCGIPIDTDGIEFRPYAPHPDGRLHLFAGIKSELEVSKGLDRLLGAARELQAKYPEKVVMHTARDLPLVTYLQRLREADVVLDQLYSYTPATNALQAMAMGKITVSGAEPEYYDFIGEKDLKPIVNVTPDDREIYQTLERLVLSSPERLAQLSHQSRRFVEHHNSSRRVAGRFLSSWQRAMHR